MQSWARSHAQFCEDGVDSCALCQLKEDFADLASTNAEAFVPRIVKSRALWAPEFVGGREECPAEAFMKLFESLLAKDLARFKSLNIDHNRAALFTLPAWRIFGSLVKRTTHCGNCNKTFHAHDWENVLTVTIPRERRVTLERALAQEFRSEPLKDSPCPSCRHGGSRCRQMAILKWPATLFIHVKRWSRGALGRQWVKDTRPISFEPTLECGGQPYTLKSVIQHIGASRNSGHYVAYGTASGEDWVCCNDASPPVKKTWDEVKMAQAYLLCYQRRETSRQSSQECPLCTPQFTCAVCSWPAAGGP